MLLQMVMINVLNFSSFDFVLKFLLFTLKIIYYRDWKREWKEWMEEGKRENGEGKESLSFLINCLCFFFSGCFNGCFNIHGRQ